MGELDEKLNAILGNQEAMGQIMALARSLGGGEPAGESEPEIKEEMPSAQPPSAPTGDMWSMLGEVDPRMIQMGMRVLQEYQKGDDKKTALLTALRPFVREERYEKLDRVIQITKLSRGLRMVFEAMRGEG